MYAYPSLPFPGSHYILSYLDRLAPQLHSYSTTAPGSNEYNALNTYIHTVLPEIIHTKIFTPMTFKFIPASALFSPAELAEYTYYSFAHNALPDRDNVSLPTAAEFAAFQTWRRLRSISPIPSSNLHTYPGFETAAQCGHPLHPGHIAALAAHDDLANPVHYCSVCALSLHRVYVAAIWKRVQAVGGPWRDDPAGMAPATIAAVKAAFSRARTAMYNDVDVLEDTAALEMAWEAENPGRDVGVAREWGAVRAMARYRNKSQFVTHKEGEAMRTPSKKRRTKRAVEFSADTPEDTTHRPSVTWCRGTTDYMGNGPWACQSDEGWCDTSFCRDWTYAVGQSRILFIYEDPAPSETREMYRELNTKLDRGENEHVQRLVYLINRWLRVQDASLLAQLLPYLAKAAHIFLVGRTEDNPESTELFDAWERRDTLDGSAVEEYAREIGDLDVEEESGAAEEEDQGAESESESESEIEDNEMQKEDECDDYDHLSLTSCERDNDEEDKDQELPGLEGIGEEDGGDNSISED
jgi:hypothetical protein